MDTSTAWVLSGGGSLGAVQVGMLQALVQAGLQPGRLIGASVGALNGAFFAANPGADGVDALARLWSRLKRRDIFPLTVWAGVKALLQHRDHFVEATRLHALICGALAIRRIEQTRVPLHIVTTDAVNGAEVVLSAGPIDTALLASTAVPVVFPPVRLGGRYLVDGGVSSNTPIATAVRLGAQRIVVLPTGTTCAATEPPHDMAALALHMLSLLSMRQLDRDVQIHAGQARISIVPPLCPLGVSVFDFTQSAHLIERARAQTAEWLAGGGLEHTGPLHVPLAHGHPAHSAA